MSNDYIKICHMINNYLTIINNKRKIRHRQKRNVEIFTKMLQSTSSAHFLTLLLNQYVAIGNLLTPNNKKIWMKPRSDATWDIMWQNENDADWIENFRMKKESFKLLCNILRPSLVPKATILRGREPVSVEKQVAVCLYKLCSCAEYRVVGAVFGIHKATVKKSVYNVSEAILKHMMAYDLHMPNETEAVEISSHFEKITKIPMILGAIDGTHIPIKPPRDGYRDFVNRKGWPSFNVQAVVDHKCCFRNIFAKYPGSAHDAAVLKGSLLYRYSEKIIPQERKSFEGMNMKYMILGDPAYPLLDWILKGFSGTCTAGEESFNVYLNAGRVVVEWAFGRLKARFRILQKKIDINYRFVPKVIVACCILHNFIETRKETFIQQWIDAVLEADIVMPQPICPSNFC